LHLVGRWQDQADFSGDIREDRHIFCRDWRLQIKSIQGRDFAMGRCNQRCLSNERASETALPKRSVGGELV
jgi:hypothetical protein